jgi:hypothetical protein
MTDWDALLLAADWRQERIAARAAEAAAMSRTHALVAERNRLDRFARYCRLAKEFEP